MAAWLAVTLSLLVPALLTALNSGLLPDSAHAIDWQPMLAGSQPWRWWSAAWVHYSGMHLAANVAGVLLVFALGWAAQVPYRAAVAWLLAWPLTHLGLLLQPAVLHYGGLSGVLHAGVAVTALWLLIDGQGTRRTIGAALIVGMLVKIVGEAPWSGLLPRSEVLDVTTVPLAHGIGLVAGLLCGALLLRPRPLLARSVPA